MFVFCCCCLVLPKFMLINVKLCHFLKTIPPFNCNKPLLWLLVAREGNATDALYIMNAGTAFCDANVMQLCSCKWFISNLTTNHRPSRKKSHPRFSGQLQIYIFFLLDPFFFASSFIDSSVKYFHLSHSTMRMQELCFCRESTQQINQHWKPCLIWKTGPFEARIKHTFVVSI